MVMAAVALAVVASLGLGLGVLVPPDAGAQVPTTTSTTRDSGEHPTFDRSPAEGPPGTVIKVWGAGCIYYGKPWEVASVSLASASKEPGHEYHQRSPEFPVADDGSWAGDIMIPASAPSGDYTLRATCWASDMGLDAGRLPFTAVEVVPPTSAEPSSTTTPSPGSPSATSRPRALAAATTPLVTTSTTVAEAVATTLSPPASSGRWRAATSLGSGGGGAGRAATLWVWVLAVPSTAALVMAVTRLARSPRRRRAGRRPVAAAAEAAPIFGMHNSR
jgi:hypothetical protein